MNTGPVERTVPHPEAFFPFDFERSIIYQTLLRAGCAIQPEVRVSAFQHGTCFWHWCREPPGFLAKPSKKNPAFLGFSEDMDRAEEMAAAALAV